MSEVQPVENVPTEEPDASPVVEEGPTEQHEHAQEEDTPLPQSDTEVTEEGLTALVTTACDKWKDKGRQKLAKRFSPDAFKPSSGGQIQTVIICPDTHVWRWI
eukprot:COSAG02_NODE_9388_length_2234_cov_1.639813_2_plen_103_part_00